jgi:hypothetical protein
MKNIAPVQFRYQTRAGLIVRGADSVEDAILSFRAQLKARPQNRAHKGTGEYKLAGGEWLKM